MDFLILLCSFLCVCVYFCCCRSRFYQNVLPTENGNGCYCYQFQQNKKKRERMRIKPINVMGRFHIYSVVFISFSHFLCSLLFFLLYHFFAMSFRVVVRRRMAGEKWVGVEFFPLSLAQLK
jgi:hypothetical protein